LFSFEVQEDIRLKNDASKEKEDVHAGKIIEKSWYEKNKHIFPANRWEVFDPSKDYGKYTIKDKALSAL
jgi:protein FAM50